MTPATLHPLLPLLPLLVVALHWGLAWAERRRAPPGERPPGLLARNGPALSAFLLLAVAFWAGVTIVLPQLSMAELSFRPKLPPAQVLGPRDVYTLENYRYFLFGSTTSTAHWNTLHLRAFATTIVSSLLVTLLDFAICYPLAWHMAKTAPPARLRLLLLLLIAPYWVNEILRAFAFRVILGANGVLNRALLGLSVVSAPVDFLGLDVGLYAGLAYAYVLMMVFPLVNAVSSLETAQVEAARDLGAPWWRIHLSIVLPQARPGIASGAVLVFMLTAGALAAPLVLGGPRTLWFTPVVYDRFYQAFNWPQGAAYAIVLLLACTLFVLAALRLGRTDLGRIAR